MHFEGRLCQQNSRIPVFVRKLFVYFVIRKEIEHKNVKRQVLEPLSANGSLKKSQPIRRQMRFDCLQNIEILLDFGATRMQNSASVRRVRCATGWDFFSGTFAGRGSSTCLLTFLCSISFVITNILNHETHPPPPFQCWICSRNFVSKSVFVDFFTRLTLLRTTLSPLPSPSLPVNVEKAIKFQGFKSSQTSLRG